MSLPKRPTERCHADARQRADSAARALEAQGIVVAVDVLDPATDPSDRWTVDILLEPSACGAPANVLAELAARDCGVLDVELQGGYWNVVATA